MKNKTLLRIVQSAIVLLLVAVLIIGIVAMPFARATDYQASFIERLDDVKVDYTVFLKILS